MKRNPNLREKYLDGEKLFRKYFEMGDAKSTEKLALWAVSNGMAKNTKSTKRNPRGLPHMGVWKSMWRWASLKENKDLAWSIFHQFNDTVSKSEWEHEMICKIKTSWQHPTEAKRQRFLKENGWI